MANVEILRAVDECNAQLALPSTQVFLPPNFSYIAHSGQSPTVESDLHSRTIQLDASEVEGP